MSPILLLSLLTVLQDAPDSAGFASILSGAISPVRDVAFVYEGDQRYVGPSEALKVPPDDVSESFQGTCAWRSDGALFMDIYMRLLNTTQPLIRDTIAILGDRTEHYGRPANHPDAEIKVMKRAVPGTFTMASSPLRIFFHWFFADTTRQRLINFRHHGDEVIDGQKSVHIQVDLLPMPTKDGVATRHYWIDLDRGGHPLRVDDRIGDHLSRRTKIQLAEFVAEDGQRIYFPVRGVVESYNLDGRFYDQPVFINTIQVVPSSVKVNQGLGDEVFRLDSKGGVTDTSSLANVRDEFLHPPPKPPIRTDFQSVQQRLDDNLAKADAQSKALDASAPREAADWTPWVQGALAGLGLALLGGAAYWRWRVA